MSMDQDELRVFVERIVNQTIGDLDARIEAALVRMARRVFSLKNLMKIGSFLIVCLTIADKLGGLL